MSDDNEFHLPPNSFVPLVLSLGLTFLFVSFLFPDAVRIPAVAVGGVWVIATLVVWFMAARSEYADLPESADH